MRISSVDFIATFDDLIKGGLPDPVIVTCDGIDRYVLLSAESYARLKSLGPAQPSEASDPDVDLDAVEWNR